LNEIIALRIIISLSYDAGAVHPAHLQIFAYDGFASSRRPRKPPHRRTCRRAPAFFDRPSLFALSWIRFHSSRKEPTMFRRQSCCRSLIFAAALVFLSLSYIHAQCKPPGNQNPPLSPAEQASVTLNGKPITIDYCAPSLKGRKVGGNEIATYDKVWRTGANSATTLKTQSTLKIGDLTVLPGTYTIYSLPEEHGWKLIINKQTGQWGTVYNQDQDLGRVKMLEGVIPSAPVEQFLINFEHTKGNKTELHLHWGTTNVFVPITAVD
jgi:hypothetical protein